MPGVLRVEHDVGLLSNKRMALEVAVAFAHLSGRRLSMPFEESIGAAPVSSVAEDRRGVQSRLLDLFELPVPVVYPDEWAEEFEGVAAETHEWGTIAHGVCVPDNEIELDDPVFNDFLNGRAKVWTIPQSDSPVLEITGRLLTFYSYFFYVTGTARRSLHATIQAVRPRRPYRELSAAIASDLGQYNAVHIRRSDLTAGIKAYGAVTPETIAVNLSDLLPSDVLLLICSEMDSGDELFEPLLARFSNVMFANDLILEDHREGFFELPRCDDNALGLVTQQIAARSHSFVGTMGSTFTGIIQRERILSDPGARFLYTADFSPPGPTFTHGEFQETRDGSFSWNRIGLNMSPDVLAWFREWPEAA